MNSSLRVFRSVWMNLFLINLQIVNVKLMYFYEQTVRKKIKALKRCHHNQPELFYIHVHNNYHKMTTDRFVYFTNTTSVELVRQ